VFSSKDEEEMLALSSGKVVDDSLRLVRVGNFPPEVSSKEHRTKKTLNLPSNNIRY
jgi:hypothetical protein